MLTFFYYFYLIIIIIKEIRMGCGAVCGDNNIVQQPNQQSFQIFIKMIPNLKNVQ